MFKQKAWEDLTRKYHMSHKLKGVRRPLLELMPIHCLELPLHTVSIVQQPCGHLGDGHSRQREQQVKGSEEGTASVAKITRRPARLRWRGKGRCARRRARQPARAGAHRDLWAT